jgi:arylsulfatase A-like enzyme
MKPSRKLPHLAVLLLAAATACEMGRTRGESDGEPPAPRRPNILLILADQWRADALGYAGDPNVLTPHLDRLAGESANFALAVSGMPVCSPYRASLMTGQRPLTHGVFVNDVPLRADAITIAKLLAAAGYDTGYIGKWHLDGRGRSSYTPPERRQGFRYWKALECTHKSNDSLYYADGPEPRRWEGYDAIAQTRDAERFIRERAAAGRPFALFLAWGAPHDPYHTAPEEFRRLYDPSRIRLRANVPAALEERARRDLAGYYAHASALDALAGDLRGTLAEAGIERDTILVFTSDHGDLIGSHGAYNKQQPFDESIRVPFLLRYPAALGDRGRKLEAPISAEDILPTLLGLCGLPIPESVEGLDFSGHLLGGEDPSGGAAVITCVQPFGQWNRPQHGAREYRGLRTRRYTYARDLDGPWLLFDNELDPYQLENLSNRPEHAELQAHLDALLRERLETQGDEFLPGAAYLERWGYEVDETGTVPYTN